MSAKKASHTRKSHLLASALVNTDAVRLVNALRGPDCLTVLAYHRIADSASPQYPYYKPNVSTTPDLFAQQMEYVANHFNIIDVDALVANVQFGKPLPPNPMLITFDDGYLDNYQHAYPILRAYNLPAVMFLVTDRMTNPAALWWDDVAYHFFHTQQSIVTLPYVGTYDLSNRRQREVACNAFIERIKGLPENWRSVALSYIHDCLTVDVPDQTPHFVSWDQVRKMSAGGISCQPHTVTHPILSRIPIGQMYWEISQSRNDIERETGCRAVAFTYPNGQPTDYNNEIIDVVRENGFSIGFTYTSGTIRTAKIPQYQYLLPRIHIGSRDTLEIFIMKVSGTRPVKKFSKGV
jgi:peptidoglycan/xylan/chitin deacetylase (PgdA/CDA1 family)